MNSFSDTYFTFALTFTFYVSIFLYLSVINFTPIIMVLVTDTIIGHVPCLVGEKETFLR